MLIPGQPSAYFRNLALDVLKGGQIWQLSNAMVPTILYPESFATCFRLNHFFKAPSLWLQVGVVGCLAESVRRRVVAIIIHSCSTSALVCAYRDPSQDKHLLSRVFCSTSFRRKTCREPLTDARALSTQLELAVQHWCRASYHAFDQSLASRGHPCKRDCT